MIYSLNITFTDDQLTNLAGTNIVIAKPLAGAQIPYIEWQVFQPWANNKFAWEEEYGIYVSNTQMQNIVALTMNNYTSIPSVINQLYTLDPSGVISGPVNNNTTSSNSFLLLNQSGNAMTVGLYATAILNGNPTTANPLSANTVLNAFTAAMATSTTLYVWLQAALDNTSSTENCGLSSTSVTSPVTKLVFGQGVYEISISYDSASGQFITVSDNTGAL